MEADNEIENEMERSLKLMAALEEEKRLAMQEFRETICLLLDPLIERIELIDKGMKIECEHVEKLALERKQNYQCEHGRVIYYPPWLDFPAGIDIEGVTKRSDARLFDMILKGL